MAIVDADVNVLTIAGRLITAKSQLLVRKHLTTVTAQTIACSVILSRSDYCNSLLYDAPVAVVEKLQRAQNNVARVICQQRRCVHARPLLKSLHQLPVQQRIQYKIAVITHKALLTSVPLYINDLLQCQVAVDATPALVAVSLRVVGNAC